MRCSFCGGITRLDVNGARTRVVVEMDVFALCASQRFSCRCASHAHRLHPIESTIPYQTCPGSDRNTAEWGANEEIFAAASDGDVVRIRDLVSSGVKVDAQVRNESTLLLSAAPHHAVL